MCSMAYFLIPKLPTMLFDYLLIVVHSSVYSVQTEQLKAIEAIYLAKPSLYCNIRQHCRAVTHSGTLNPALAPTSLLLLCWISQEYGMECS